MSPVLPVDRARDVRERVIFLTRMKLNGRDLSNLFANEGRRPCSASSSICATVSGKTRTVGGRDGVDANRFIALKR